MSAHRSFGLTLTNGFVIVEQESLRGLNIGSLCFNEIVKWARRVAPDDHVMPIQLLGSHVGAYGRRNLERRHRFYQRFGLTFEFESGDCHGAALWSQCGVGIRAPLEGRHIGASPRAA